MTRPVTPAKAPGSSGRAPAMPFILIAVLIDMMAIGLIVPVLPLIVGVFTRSPGEQTFWFGAVTFTFGVANFFAAPVLGALSDRYGRRPVLLLGFCGLATSFIVTGLATALWMLIAVRLVSGAMQANAAVANAYVADITAPADRARRFGLLGAMFGIGFILGPAMGGLLGAIDIHLPFFAAGTLAIANWLYGFFVLPESLPPERRRAFEWRRANPFAALRRLGALKGVGPLIAVRLVSGAMQANAAVANAYVADITPAEERARRFGLVGAMFGLGFTLGPVVGGLLGAVDVRLPFFAAGTLAIANGLYGWFVLPESLPPERRRPFAWQRANPVAALKGLARLEGVGPLVAVIGLAALAQFTLHTSWVLYTTFKFGWGPAQNGWSLFVVGVMSALVQGVLLRHLLKRFSPQRLATVGLIASALTYLGFGLATQGWMIFVVIVVGTLLGGGAQAAIQSLVSNAADAHSQGQTAGSVASLTSLMAVLAPTIAAPLLGIVSHLPRGDMRIGLPFFFCALLQAAGAIIAFLHFRRQRAGHAPATA